MNLKEEEIDKAQFNLKFENQNGTVPLIILKDVINDIITSNKKNDRKITVIYNDTKTTY